MTQTSTATQTTTEIPTGTWIIERVSGHGRTDEHGNRYGRAALIVATTEHASEVNDLRAAAKALIETGSSDWIEARQA